MPMGPEDPLAIIEVRRIDLPHGVRRTDVIYPDGVEIEYRMRLPAAVEATRTVALSAPDQSFLTSVHMDEESDGFTYAYHQRWLICTRDCKTCPVRRSGVTVEICKLVDV
ncbi:hypothetical protein GCM10010149_48010 [Nonomuraea roseoviolacea subsp. roseoviolacea]|uniref:hypothetical protein n=1 Tax=Nonomuraea roseoviolacea TaxID=103837 RepID=UPI0031D317BD